MKTKPAHSPTHREPTEEEIRDYAYHLYVQGGGVSGHELDDWLEAVACLKAGIPAHRSRARLHHHVRVQESESGPDIGDLCTIGNEARHLAS